MAKAKGAAERIEDAVAGMWKSATNPAPKRALKKAKTPKKKTTKKTANRMGKKQKPKGG